MKTFMNAPPANVDCTYSSLNTLRNWTSGASSEPYATDAITQARPAGVTVAVATVVVVVVRSTADVWVAVDVVVVVVVDEYIEVVPTVTGVVTVGE